MRSGWSEQIIEPAAPTSIVASRARSSTRFEARKFVVETLGTTVE
jgi:hypothetical protein